MEFSVYQLRTFSDVARTGSITKSAKNLGYSQSSVTAHVRSLELRVGSPLFQRLPHGVRLTRAGRMVKGYVEQILTVVDTMSSALQRKGEAVGRVTIGAPAAVIDLIVPSLLTEAQLRYPGVFLAPRVVPAAEILPLMSDGGLDIAFMLGGRGEGALPRDDSLTALDLFPVDMVAVRSTAGPAADFTAIAEGDEVRGVAVDSGCASHLRLVDVLRERRGADVVAVETGSLAGAKELVLAGAGVAMLPLHVVGEHLTAGDLVALDEDFGASRLFAKALWPNRDWLSPAVAAMVDVVRRQAASPRQLVSAN